MITCFAKSNYSLLQCLMGIIINFMKQTGTTNPHKNSNGGAIAGGLIVAVVLILLLLMVVVIVLWVLRRRSKVHVGSYDVFE